MHTHKQVIVVRKDLNMRKGKMCAQAAHASMKALLDLMFTSYEVKMHSPDGTKEATYLSEFKVLAYDDRIWPWVTGNFAKIVVGVDSEAELLVVHYKAKEAGLITSLIQDAGLTEFGGIPTYTTVAVGPDLNEKVDTITKDLKLL